MTRYIARRLLGAVPLLFGIATLIFFLIRLAPGDPAVRYITSGMTPEVIEQIRLSLGLDEPLHIQYFLWMRSMLSGDFGQSFTYSRPVVDVIGDFLPATLLLSGCALLLSFVVGVLIGAVQAVRQYSVLDSGLSVLSLFFYSMPSFWLGLMLILTLSLFARNVWEWPIYFPPSGMQSIGAGGLTGVERIADRAYHLALPVLSLALVLTAGIARYMRGGMLEVVRQDYIRTARAKGLSEPVVMFKHGLRNALLPIVTLLGLYIPVLFSGTVFIEFVFSWPGMGRAIVAAISERDYPMIMGASFLFAAMVIVSNIIADVLYAVVDPRIRYE